MMESAVGAAEGISGETVKFIEIRKNTNGENTLVG